MNRLRPIFSAGLLTLSGSLYALSPYPGLYVGGIFGGTYEPDLKFTGTNPATNQPVSSTLGFEALINAGFQIGYRFCDRYRLEAELLYNKNPYSFLRIGDTTVHSPDTSTGLRIDGNTTEGFGFINGYYDFLGDGTSDVVPYVGIGAGYAYVHNVVKFYYNEELLNGSHSVNSTRPAGQAIVGVSYFLDDFMSFAIDARYYATATEKITNRLNQAYNTHVQIASINLLFNGALELG
jgi:opacity protein-like surface antigen